MSDTVVERRIVDVLSSLDDAESTLVGAGDANAYFVALYRATTSKCLWLEAAILDPNHPGHRDHHHLDARLIRDIVVHFEPRYSRELRARYSSGSGDSDANPWRRVLAHAAEGSPASVLVLGAHTHIAFDLPVVLAMDVGGDRPLFDHRVSTERTTLAALNGLFMDEIVRIVANVAAVEAGLASKGSTTVGGSVRWLYHARTRRVAVAPIGALLTLARREAKHNALRLRRSTLDETRLATMVDRRNRLLLHTWRWIGRRHARASAAAGMSPGRGR